MGDRKRRHFGSRSAAGLTSAPAVPRHAPIEPGGAIEDPSPHVLDIVVVGLAHVVVGVDVHADGAPGLVVAGAASGSFAEEG